MLRNLTFAVQFAYFSIRPKKFCFFFEQLLSQKATVEQLLDKSRETFWKISSNLWKALGAATHKGLLPGVGYRISIPTVLREKRGLWNDYHWARENNSILSCYQQLRKKFKSLSNVLLYNLCVYNESSLCDVLTSYVVKNHTEVQKSLFMLNLILHLWSVAFEVSLRALLFN